MAIGRTNICSGGGNLGLSVTPQDVRMGKTFSRDGKTVENGQLNLTNLSAENIKSGINIGGVVGNFEADLNKYIKVKNLTNKYPPTWYQPGNYLILQIGDNHVNSNFHRFRINYTGKLTLNLTQKYRDNTGSYIIYKNGRQIKEGEISSQSYSYVQLEVNRGDIIHIRKFGYGENILIFGYELDLVERLTWSEP